MSATPTRSDDHTPSHAGARSEQFASLAVSVYRILLLLYPKSFRRAYAAQMAQVFAASSRKASREGGALALARLCWFTLGDLLATALAERLELGMPGTLRALYRTSGMVAMTGVAVWILGGSVLSVALALLNPAGNRQPPFAVMMTMPIAWLFFVIGLIGLYALLAHYRGALIWLPGTVALCAVLALIVATMYWTYNSQIGVQSFGAATVVNLAQASVVNQALDYSAYVVMNQAYPALGLALFVTGLLTLRTPATRLAARTLLVVGALGMLYYFFTDMGAPSLLRNTGTPGALGMAAGALVFFGAWLVGWLLLGRWLWRAGATPVANPDPAVTPPPTPTGANITPARE